MQIQFGLPTGAGGMAAAQEAGRIRSQLKQWSQQYGIPYHTRSERWDYRTWLILTFDRDSDYTHWALTWQGKTFMQPQLINNG